MAHNCTLHLVSAHRGASGATVIDGATMADVILQASVRTARGAADALPVKVRMTRCDPVIRVYTEDIDEQQEAVSDADADEILKLVVKTAAGNKTHTIDVKRMGSGTVEFKSREGNATVTRTYIEFAVVTTDTHPTLAQAWTIA